MEMGNARTAYEMAQEQKRYLADVERVKEDASSLQTDYLMGYLHCHEDESEKPLRKATRWIAENIFGIGEEARITGYREVLDERLKNQ